MGNNATCNEYIRNNFLALSGIVLREVKNSIYLVVIFS